MRIAATIEQGAVSKRLSTLVGRACDDPVFRRELRYRPHDALSQFGLASDDVPELLPIRHYEVSASFAPELLFGSASPPCSAPPRELPIEIRQVAYGLKPMALVHGMGADLEALVAQLRELQLHALLSPYEFTPDADETAAGYVNLACAKRPATSRSLAWRGALVARDWRQLQLGWLCLLFGWDSFLGALLGYPACCARAYAENWPVVAADFRGEYGAFLAGVTDRAQRGFVVQPAHCAMNVFARYFGIHVLEHFPCSFGCDATRGLAQRMCAGLAEMEPASTEQLLRALGAPVLYAQGDGAFLFERASWDADHATLAYDASAMRSSNAKSDLSRALRAANTLQVVPDGVHVGEQRCDGRLFVFPALQ
jgi:hypothetical protein